MNKIVAFLGAAIITCTAVQAIDVVYPAGKYNQTEHDSVYFMGTLDKGETLYLLNEKVNTAKNGAFAFTVPLKTGRNQVFLRIYKDGHSTIKQYYITKISTPARSAANSELIPIGKTVFTTVSDMVPLRSSPVDAGMNRMSHLSMGTILIADAQMGDFYRIYLTPTRYGWVDKKHVRQAYDDLGYPLMPELALFYNIDDKTIPDLSLYRAAFTHNLPYEVIDTPNELVINIFNVANMNDETLVLRAAKNELVKYSTSFTNGDFTLLMKASKFQKGLPLSGINVVVDAGHGGSEKGALGIFRDNEKDINLQIAQALRTELERQGAVVYMTRNSDMDVSLYDRVKLAKAYDANMFISIHMNSVPQGADPNVRKGSGVYYYNSSARSLAESIKNSLTSGLSTQDDGVRQESFAVIRPSEYLGVLAEICYMVNPQDTEIYKSDKFVQKAALSICSGVVDYASKNITNTNTAKLVGISEKNSLKNKKVKKVKQSRQKRIKVKAEMVPKQSKEKLLKQERIDVKHEEQTPFFDTSVREKYEQEAIYIIDKDDTKWYRPRGKKKRVKRPPREIKQDVQLSQNSSVNIFASGDYEEVNVVEKISFRTRCRNFFSKLGSYFYNGAKN